MYKIATVTVPGTASTTTVHAGATLDGLGAVDSMLIVASLVGVTGGDVGAEDARARLRGCGGVLLEDPAGLRPDAHGIGVDLDRLVGQVRVGHAGHQSLLGQAGVVSMR